VTFRGQTAKVKAHEGKDGEAQPIEGRRSRRSDCPRQKQNRVENVLVGEVWICSASRTWNGHWIKPLRLVQTSKAQPTQCSGSVSPQDKKANLPMDDVKAQWKECNPKSVPSFSAVAYYFGRDLQKALKVPVG